MDQIKLPQTWSHVRFFEQKNEWLHFEWKSNPKHLKTNPAQEEEEEEDDDDVDDDEEEEKKEKVKDEVS
jgi:hypothetical protein